MKEYNWREEQKKYQPDFLKQAMAKPEPPPAPAKKNCLAAILIILLLVLGIGSAGYWWFYVRAVAPSSEAENTVAVKASGADSAVTSSSSFEEIVEAKKHAVGIVALQVFIDNELMSCDEIGTVWAFAPTQFATNAHVANGLYEMCNSNLPLLYLVLAAKELEASDIKSLVAMFGTRKWNLHVKTKKAALEKKQPAANQASLTEEQLNAQIEKQLLQETGYESKAEYILEEGRKLAIAFCEKKKDAYRKRIRFEAIVLINQMPGISYPVEAIQSHPLYESDNGTATTDVGIVTIKGHHTSYFEIASDESLMNLRSGREIAFLGFPSESLIKDNVKLDCPVATFQAGQIVAVSDFQLRDAGSKGNYYIRHNLPAVGGASGSPIFGRDGKVVALLNGGNMVRALVNGKVKRTPSAAMVNYGVRVDLLKGVGEGVPVKEWLDRGDTLPLTWEW